MVASVAAAAFEWPRIAVFGAGAVGCYFGARLAEAGAPVTLIARPVHAQAIAERGLIFDSAGRQRTVMLAAQSEPDALRNADLVLFCVKSGDTESGARELARWLRGGATVVSLQNGVDNADRMRDSAALDAMAAVVYVAASMPGPGHLLHAGRGDLVIGEVSPAAPGADRAAGRPARFAALCERASIPCRVSDDVRAELWIKLAMNCAFNAISALARSRYGPMMAAPSIRALMGEVVAECVAVARADDIGLPEAAVLLEAALALGAAMGQATSSTSQDIERGRASEIDSLNGYVDRRGRVLGVPTPVNRALFALVKLLEARAE